MGEHGWVAAGHRRTVRAAHVVLAAGGNAFDAAVAAGFAAAVVEPCLTSLGGGGFLLARTAAGDEVVFDFFADGPGRGAASDLDPHFLPVGVDFGGADQTFNVGMGSVAVPGVLAGYLWIHRRLGRLPLAAVTGPAIELATDGVVVNEQQAYLVELLWPILGLGDAGRALFAPTGRPVVAGDRFVNRDLAAFLRDLDADRGSAGFGGHADGIEADMRAGGGLLTRADMDGYLVVERAPLAVGFAGRRVLTNPAPSFGGELVALGLAMLDERPVHRWGSPSCLADLADVMVEVDRVRAARPPGARFRSSGGTTHLSVADSEGNVASMTTSNGEGSGYVVPGTGVMLNNMLGEDDLHEDGFHAAVPGERISSMMAPTIVLGPDRVELVAGSGGSKRIRTVLLQLVAAAVRHGVDLESAVAGPRIHWDGEIVQVEPGFSRDAVASVAGRYPVNEWQAPNLYFGGAHAVVPGRAAVGDPRRGGYGE